MIYTPKTKKAMIIAYNAHNGQVDKSGIPYIYHPIHLAEQMDTETECIVALLHDVVEDTNVTFDELEKNFSPEVIEGLKLLTHDKNVDYLEYIRKIKNNPIARKVKLADLYHNSDPTRMENPTPKDLERKEKLKLISNGENILISFEEWRALKEQILAKAKNNNIGGLISWKEYRYNPYGNYTELDEYVIRLQNQLLHIYEYENQIQANLEQLTEERKEMLERKAQEDSKEDEMIGWKKILGNQYSLEESFDIEAVLENNSKVLSHFEQILKETVNSQKVGKGTRESVQIILDNMQNSQEERE